MSDIHKVANRAFGRLATKLRLVASVAALYLIAKDSFVRAPGNAEYLSI